MRIRVLLFAILRDTVGAGRLELDLPAGSNAADASRRLRELHPAAARHLDRVAYAVNQTYVPAQTELHDGQELALIPPVSGG